jgi:16S rRNA (cytosine1402-N4)-methyltransferase
MRHNQSEYAHTPVLYREILDFVGQALTPKSEEKRPEGIPVSKYALKKRALTPENGDQTAFSGNEALRVSSATGSSETLTPSGAGQIIVDCTLGEGGHSEMFLSRFPEARVFSFERDPVIIEIAKKRLAPFGSRFTPINRNFSEIAEGLSGLEGEVSAILYDFGISSFHFDRSGRGFTYADDEPLDMRLDGKGKSAFDVVNTYRFEDLAKVIGEYGEERWAGKIARRIIEEREKSPIKTSRELSEIIFNAVPRRFHDPHIHPATRSFQGIRIEVNGELEAIERSLAVSYKFLKKSGLLLAMSFHSLEDRIAKNAFRTLERGCSCVRNDLCTCDRVPKVRILTRKPIEPRDDEIAENRRARSAKLRVCERI